MKTFVLLLGSLFLVVGCESEATNASEATAPSGAELGIEEHIWVAEDIGGKGIIDNSHLVLTLNAGQASGKSGCNSYSGSYTLSGEQISFGPLASTRMACAVEAMMNQERDYLGLLSKVSVYERGEGGVLLLKTPDGQSLRFVAE